MEYAPRISLCICTRNRPEELRRALDSVRRSSVVPLEVIVSDDGEGPAAQDVCAAASTDVTYAQGPRLGLGPNRNHALRFARGELVLFMDDDCELGELFIERSTRALVRSEGRFGEKRVITSGRERNGPHLVGAGRPSFLGHQRHRYRPGDRRISLVINAALFPRALFEVVAFDPAIRYGHDEIDLAARAVGAGWTIVEVPDAINDHHPSESGRAGQHRDAAVARLYVTWKRLAFVDHAAGRAGVYVLVASIHLLASETRAGGPRGLLRGVSLLVSFATTAAAHRRKHRSIRTSSR